MFPQWLTVWVRPSGTYWKAAGKEVKDILGSKKCWGKANMGHLLWLVIHWRKAIATFKLYYHLRCLMGRNICFNLPLCWYKSLTNPSQWINLFTIWKGNFLNRIWPLLFFQLYLIRDMRYKRNKTYPISYILHFLFFSSFNFLATTAIVM